MPSIKIETEINADARMCFDLARDIDFHQETLKFSKEKAIAGRISGLIGPGEWVSWEANHLGFVQHLTSKITEFDAPNYFVVEMVLGAFESFRLVYHFTSSKHTESKTIMTNIFHFKSPYKLLGRFADEVFLKRYMRNLIKRRGQSIKDRAEELYRVL
ncbi:SRPBCC family protein [Aestuariivivens insulae]|uniref:SRPBCC family protein n=1 Tax=Aestuariivivens insulae TaxID=1621988 RepID=UPI001F5ABB7B|nr:SRPBCC family protein [Aestuariivivens insulae]